jgi:hypothetical protein
MAAADFQPLTDQHMADIRFRAAAAARAACAVVFSTTDWHVWEHDDAATIEDELAL